MPKPSCPYKRHRFPTEIIARAVWLYYRYPLSLRLVEEMLLERGIVVSYETIRQWCTRGHKFGPKYARRLQRKQPSRNDIWHLDDSVARQGFAEQKPRGSRSVSTVRSTGCGVPLIRMGMCRMKLFRPGAIPKQQKDY